MKTFYDLLENLPITEDQKMMLYARYIKDMTEAQEQLKKALDLLQTIAQKAGVQI